MKIGLDVIKTDGAIIVPSDITIERWTAIDRYVRSLLLFREMIDRSLNNHALAAEEWWLTDCQ